MSFEMDDSGFVPMYLDSSPPPYIEGSGFAEPRPDLQLPLSDSSPSHLYNPARISFYPDLMDDLSQCPPVAARTPPPKTSISDWSQGSRARRGFSWSDRGSPIRSDLTSLGRSASLSSPSYLELPPPFAEAQFISDIPLLNPSPTPASSVPSPLPPSDLSAGFSWIRPSSGVTDFDEVPQGSFPPSCNDVVVSPPGCNTSPHAEADTKSLSTEGSVYSFLGDALDDPRLCDAIDTDDDNWKSLCLTDVLGRLFEDANPWSVLDVVLGLPPSHVPTYASVDLSEMLPDRRGVGYVTTSPRASRHPLISDNNVVYECFNALDVPLVAGNRLGDVQSRGAKTDPVHLPADEWASSPPLLACTASSETQTSRSTSPNRREMASILPVARAEFQAVQVCAALFVPWLSSNLVIPECYCGLSGESTSSDG